MSKRCELTGISPLKGHNVSHAKNKTKRRFLPNLKKVKFKSEILKKSLKLTVSNAGVRSVDKKGSFDEFIKSAKPLFPVDQDELETNLDAIFSTSILGELGSIF